jgi:hypothetical protein
MVLRACTCRIRAVRVLHDDRQILDVAIARYLFQWGSFVDSTPSKFFVMKNLHSGVRPACRPDRVHPSDEVPQVQVQIDD